LRNAFHYAAVHLASIADNARDVDFCMRWGFGMKQGPFELWQEAGWLEVARMVQEDIDAGQSAVQCTAARVGFQWPRGRRWGCAHPCGFVEPDYGSVCCTVRSLPVYARQHFPGERAGRQCTLRNNRRQHGF
jgi:3-hydroxyacyl-CoA dehydrogenase